MAQIQCPHCGGFIVDTLKTESIGENTKRGNSLVGCLWIVGFMLVILPVVIALAIMIVTIPLAIWLWRWYGDELPKKMSGYVERAKKYQFRCKICGYEWQWRTDQPYPEIQMRPDLIAKAQAREWYCLACGNANAGTRYNCSVCGTAR